MQVGCNSLLADGGHIAAQGAERRLTRVSVKALRALYGATGTSSGLGGPAVSLLGDFFSVFAIPLLVFGLTGSALQTGLSLAFGTLPYVVVRPFAGVLIDRADRRQIMIGTRITEMMLIGSIPAAAAFGWLTLGQIYAVSFLAGSASVVFGAATLSTIPQIVAAEQLVPANALQQASLSVCSLIGPPLAGLVVAVTDAPVAALAVDAVTFLIAAILIATIHRPMQDRRDDQPRQESSPTSPKVSAMSGHTGSYERSRCCCSPSTSCWGVSSVS